MTTAPHAAPSTTWQIDPAHTDVEFSVRHLMISTVKGRFGDIAGSVAIGEHGPGTVALDVSIPVASLDTRVAQRDAHLRSPDFFDVERYPAITFRATRVEGDLGDRFRLAGDLTIRGVSREVALDVTLDGRGNDPWGNERMGYSATGTIDRRDFGLTYNQVLETGGFVVGDEIRIAIQTELMRPLA